MKKKANPRNPLLAGGKGRYTGSHFSNHLSNMKKLFRSMSSQENKTMISKHTINTSAARLNNQGLARRSASVSSDASTKNISSNKFFVTKNNNAFMAPVRKISSSSHKH